MHFFLEILVLVVKHLGSLFHLSYSLRLTYDQWYYPSCNIFSRKFGMQASSTSLGLYKRSANARILNNQVSTSGQIKELILLKLSWWINGWVIPFHTPGAILLGTNIFFYGVIPLAQSPLESHVFHLCHHGQIPQIQFINGMLTPF